MASQPPLFTATRAQTLTYLLGVCPFSIAFLVFINSSVSFVVTELIGIHEGQGDVVGTLGFADELLALAACPLWGVLSDRIGVRYVCTVGYAIVALSLVLFVQAVNVYPQLLLGRLLFSLGASAVSTMVTAVLPAVTDRSMPVRQDSNSDTDHTSAPASRLAGFVGMCAGCGALVALVVFLPLPARLQQSGLSPPQSIQCSYYLVAAVAVVVSIGSLIGLKDLPGEEHKGWGSLWSTADDPAHTGEGKPHLPCLGELSTAVALGFHNRDIFIGYLGGFVARASSVGISLFIPLAVNHYYLTSGLCHDDSAGSPGDIKRSCPRAYVLASILTGVSQLVALIVAPAMGYLSEKSRRYHLPLLTACFAGAISFTAFALLPSPEYKGQNGTAAVFLIMGLMGISQIGAIVCSLAVLSNGILQVTGPTEPEHANPTGSDPSDPPNEQRPLLARPAPPQSRRLSHLKGSIAGVYSLYGGAGILLLTKVGGLLFDVLSSGAPFYILAGFNGVLFLAGVTSGLLGSSKWLRGSHIA
ncbi:MFS transporter [Aspergillus campestris IBT 28561]|uniref:MFS transporter n=1 Tax=Aspergillus campestris (strain IBT 28561) TaxID=1392248 RepID=A0A2I1DAT5_ASPC2|nr:MFS transporter [Aspergillus campestris IBT 28561]PKY06979.1 MFS transporter [Aspergillus campestris IBT 28561]